LSNTGFCYLGEYSDTSHTADKTDFTGQLCVISNYMCCPSETGSRTSQTFKNKCWNLYIM